MQLPPPLSKLLKRDLGLIAFGIEGVAGTNSHGQQPLSHSLKKINKSSQGNEYETFWEPEHDIIQRRSNNIHDDSSNEDTQWPFSLRSKPSTPQMNIILYSLSYNS